MSKKKTKQKKKTIIKQKQSQKQNVVVNIITDKDKKKKSSKKSKKSNTYNGPLIQSLPLSYIPQVMYQQIPYYDEINRNAIIPTEAIQNAIQEAIPILNIEQIDNIEQVDNQNINDEYLARLNKETETYNRLNKENDLLIDYNKQNIKIENDIMENINQLNYRKSSDVYDENIYNKGADATDIVDLTTEELEEKTKQRFRRKNNIECEICKGSYDPTSAYSSQKHYSTKKHKQALEKLENSKKN